MAKPHDAEWLATELERFHQARANKTATGKRNIQKALAARRRASRAGSRTEQLLRRFDEDGGVELAEWMAKNTLRAAILLGCKIEAGTATGAEINTYLKVSDPIYQKLSEAHDGKKRDDGPGDSIEGLDDQDVEDQGEDEPDVPEPGEDEASGEVDVPPLGVRDGN